MQAKTFYPCQGKRYWIVHRLGYIVEVEKHTHAKVANLEFCKDTIHNMNTVEMLVIQGKYNFMDGGR